MGVVIHKNKGKFEVIDEVAKYADLGDTGIVRHVVRVREDTSTLEDVLNTGLTSKPKGLYIYTHGGGWVLLEAE